MMKKTQGEEPDYEFGKTHPGMPGRTGHLPGGAGEAAGSFSIHRGQL